MKCSRITLFDRKENLIKKNLQKHPCQYERSFQPQLPNYLSWLNKPYTMYEDDQPYLTVCNLVLPKNAAVSTDRGAQSDRWVHKRPRLKSAKQQSRKKDFQNSDAEDFDDEEQKHYEEEKDSEIMEIQQVLQEYEIDENVQRLIQEAAEYDRQIEEQLNEIPNDQEEMNKRKHKKHKTKETRNNETKERAKVRLNRTVTVSLSRPPSPETIQVIRVDVTSNYSLEEFNAYVDDADEDSDDYYDEEKARARGRIQCERETGNEKAHATNQQLDDNNAANASNRLYTRKSLMKSEEFSAELAVQCQKLALTERRTDVVN